MRRLRELLSKEGGSVAGADDWALFADVVQREVPAWATFVGEVVESGAGAKQEVAVEEKHVTKQEKGVDVRKFGLPPVSLPKYSGVKGKCADWWEQMRTTLQELGVPEENWRTLLRSSLSGNALAVFIRIEKQDKNVRAIMAGLVVEFDTGTLHELLKKEEWLRQTRGESIMAFRLRFEEPWGRLR